MDKRFTIGVLVGNANSPHTMDILRGIYRVAKIENVNIIFFQGIHVGQSYRAYFGENAGDDFDYQVNIVYDYVHLSEVDALIVLYGSMCMYINEEKYEFLDRFSGIPYVLIEEEDQRGVGSSIISDNYHGIAQMMRHLIEVHHCREFTFLSGPKENTDAEQRKQAFLDVLKEYDLPCEEQRVEYGDFTICVEAQVQRLLRDYPQMEAIVCANDMMADTVYQELHKIGLEVGKDVLVTGYDDWVMAESMSPPLSTIKQNSYEIGYMAAVEALRLCRGETPRSMIAPVELIFRESCGCSVLEGYVKWKDLLQHGSQNDIIHTFANAVSRASCNENAYSIICEQVTPLLRLDYSIDREGVRALSLLKKMLNHKYSEYISLQALMRTFDDFLYAKVSLFLVSNPDINGARKILRRREQIREIITAYYTKENDEKASAYQLENWFLPLISRDMVAQIENEQDFYASAVKRLAALRAKSTFLCIFKDPIVHRAGEKWVCPSDMYLAASQIGNMTFSYPSGARPVINKQNGLDKLGLQDSSHSLSVFCLFSGEMQYGILVSEIDPDNLSLAYQISMQITNGLRFYAMAREQIRTKKKLEAVVSELNDKNAILNFISEYDPLTGFLNRRGFMEHAVQYAREHAKDTAMMLYADLNYLKTINDMFGHNEGDWAICSAAKILQQVVGPEGIVGRVGGDEFAAILPKTDDRMEEILQHKLRAACEHFNMVTDKIYLVELAIGAEEFECRENVPLIEIMGLADKKLYQAKKLRRGTIYKNAVQEAVE